jgi:hypothetical protein
MEVCTTDDKAISTLRKALCELFVCHHTDALKCVLTSTEKLNEKQRKSIVVNTVSMIAAVAAIGDLKALRATMMNSVNSLWRVSPAFGYP